MSSSCWLVSGSRLGTTSHAPRRTCMSFPLRPLGGAPPLTRADAPACLPRFGHSAEHLSHAPRRTCMSFPARATRRSTISHAPRRTCMSFPLPPLGGAPPLTRPDAPACPSPLGPLGGAPSLTRPGAPACLSPLRPLGGAPSLTPRRTCMSSPLRTTGRSTTSHARAPVHLHVFPASDDWAEHHLARTRPGTPACLSPLRPLGRAPSLTPRRASMSLPTHEPAARRITVRRASSRQRRLESRATRLGESAGCAVEPPNRPGGAQSLPDTPANPSQANPSRPKPTQADPSQPISPSTPDP